MFGVHKHSKGLWDIIRPTLVCQTAGTSSSFSYFEFLIFPLHFTLSYCLFPALHPVHWRSQRRSSSSVTMPCYLWYFFWEIYLWKMSPCYESYYEKSFFNWKNVCLRLMEKRCFQAAVFLRLWCMSAKTLAGHSKTNTRKKISKNALLCFWW